MELDFGSITLLLISDSGDLKDRIHRIFNDQIVFNLSPKTRFFNRFQHLAKIYRYINFIILDFSDEKPSSKHWKMIPSICDHFVKSHVVGILPDEVSDIKSGINHKRFYPVKFDNIDNDLRNTIALIASS